MPSDTAAAWRTLGFAIGHATDASGATGCTIIRGVSSAFPCAAHLLGRASGTRDLAVCHPDHVTERVDAVMLTGGSAYGLDAAAGVMRWMEERGRGHPIGAGVVPIVPAATIFDLVPLGEFAARPTAQMAYDACEGASSDNIAEGSVGAGTGATVGKISGAHNAMKGGVGCGSASNGAVLAAAVVVTNALGDIRDAHGAIIAGARTAQGTLADGEALLRAPVSSITTPAGTADHRGNTTIAFVAVNALLTKSQLAQLATATSAAFYRRITPCGTSVDGDVIFAAGAPLGIIAPMPVVEALAVAAMEEAIERSVRMATGRDGIPAAGELDVRR